MLEHMFDTAVQAARWMQALQSALGTLQGEEI
jgi:hypothetical protein